MASSPNDRHRRSLPPQQSPRLPRPQVRRRSLRGRLPRHRLRTQLLHKVRDQARRHTLLLRQKGRRPHRPLQERWLRVTCRARQRELRRRSVNLSPVSHSHHPCPRRQAPRPLRPYPASNRPRLHHPPQQLNGWRMTPAAGLLLTRVNRLPEPRPGVHRHRFASRHRAQLKRLRQARRRNLWNPPPLPHLLQSQLSREVRRQPESLEKFPLTGCVDSQNVSSVRRSP